MTERRFLPGQRAKPTEDLEREFFAGGKGSSGSVRTATASLQAAGPTTALDLEVPPGRHWKLRRLLLSAKSDFAFTLALGKAGSETIQVQGDVRKEVLLNLDLEELSVGAPHKAKVIIDAGAGPTTVKATLFFEELS